MILYFLEDVSEVELARNCAEFFDIVHRLLAHRRTEVSQNEVIVNVFFEKSNF